MPFLVLPLVLWWAIPLGLVVLSLWRARPAWWAWPFIGLALCLPRTLQIVIEGNSSMWVAGLVAAACLWGWPGALVLVKPSLAPHALVGIPSRGWWLAFGAMALLSLPLLGAWVDYLAAMRNGGASVPLGYSLADVPFIRVPLVGWLARQRAQVIADLGFAKAQAGFSPAHSSYWPD